MVKIRAFISKKAVPRGIDIDNKEYWQPYAVTIKGKGGQDDEGDDGQGGDDPQPQPGNTKCKINIATVPDTATIVATDEEGHVFTSKTFEVTKGQQVTIIATPDASSTGYKPTTKILTSAETNQDTFNYNFILDSNTPVEETTTINIVPNIAGVLTYVYTSNGLLLNPDGSNTVQNVSVGSVIKVKPVKEGYKLKTSSIGTISTEDGYDVIIGINVTKNLLINLSFESVSDELPVIKGVENDYQIFADAQEFVRVFKSTFYKIRIYGDLPLTLATSWATSVQDSLGGHSITDTNQNHHGEQDVSVIIPISENVTGVVRRFNFTIIAENKSGQQVSKSFVVVQYQGEVQTYKVSIITKINNVVTGTSDIIRKIDGKAIAANEEIDVPAGSEITFYASYLGKEFTEIETINSNTTKEFNFEVVNISLGTVKDESGDSLQRGTYRLTLNVPSLQITKNNWESELIPVIKNTEYIVTGTDLVGGRPDYNSGIRIADGSQINVVFKDEPQSAVTIITKWFNPSTGLDEDVISNVTLRVGTVSYNNGWAFTNGTKVGYVIEATGYEIKTLSDGSPNAIVAGLTHMPVIVYLTKKVEYVNVTIRTTLDNNLAAGAQIYLEGQFVGTGSPFVMENLINGESYNFRVELDGQLPYSSAFTASPEKVVYVEFNTIPVPPSKYGLAVTMLDPSDAKIEVNDYTDGQSYVAYGQLYQQIGSNHRITIKMSKEGYAPKYIPHGAGDYTPGDERGTLLMNENKNFLDRTLDPFAPSSQCTYSLNVIPSDAKVEFSETNGGNYQEYPNHTYVTYIGRTVYWRVSKEGYVTQTGNSGVLSGNKTDSVTLQQEQPGINNNVLFVINSIKDKDTNEDVTGVTISMQLKGITQSQNKTISQTDIDEVSDNPPSDWNNYIGKFGGVSAKGTDIKFVITKEGYETLDRWTSNFISVEPDYESNKIVLDLVIQTPKCRFTLYPIQDINNNPLIPEHVYIKEGNDNFTSDDEVFLVANRYSKEINRGSDIYYMVLKTGYGGGYGLVQDVEFSQSRAVSMAAISPTPQDTINLRVYGTNDGLKRFPKIAASAPFLIDLDDHIIYSGTFVGGSYYAYDFVVPKNHLLKIISDWGNNVVSLIGSFSKDAEVLMWFQLQSQNANNTNLWIYPMEQGNMFMNNDKHFNLVLRDSLNNSTINRNFATQDSNLKYMEGYTVRKKTIISFVAKMDTYADIVKSVGVEDVNTIYLDFINNPVLEDYLRISLDGGNTFITGGMSNLQFDGNGDSKDIIIQSNINWVVE